MALALGHVSHGWDVPGHGMCSLGNEGPPQLALAMGCVCAREMLSARLEASASQRRG